MGEGLLLLIGFLALAAGLFLGRLAWVWLDIVRDVRRGPVARRFAERGIEAFRQGELLEAQRLLRIGLAEDSLDLNAWAALGYALLADGDEFAAGQALAAAARRSGELAALLGIETSAYGPFFQPEELVGIPTWMRLDRETRLWPLVQSGRYRQALRSVELYVRMYESSSLTDLFRASCLARLGEREAAEDCLERCLEADPQDAFVLYQAGKLQREFGALERARELHERLVYRHAQYALSHFALGLTLWEAGREAEALRALLRAENLAGIHPDLWLLLGEAYLDRGERGAGIQALWRCLGVAGPPREFAAVIQRARRRLRGLGEPVPGGELS